jgi:hypothetical protein
MYRKNYTQDFSEEVNMFCTEHAVICVKDGRIYFNRQDLKD